MTQENPVELPTAYARDIEIEPTEDRWLVEGFWGRSSVGILGGAPKSLKTWVGLDLSLSVASGTQALGHFPVQAPGTALVYLAEDSLPQVRSRIESICRHRHLEIQQLDLVVITEPTLRLDTGRDQERLRATLARFRPRLLLLDPLVRLHRLDENSSLEISALLGYFRELQRTFDLAIILVHHTSKKNRAQPGQALRGSSDLHAFGDSNAYLAREGDQITLTLEHRSARAPKPMTLKLISGDSETHIALCGDVPAEGEKPSLKNLLLMLLRESGGPIPRTEIRAQLRVNNQRLGELLYTLEKSGVIFRTPRGWILNNLQHKGPSHERQEPMDS